MNSKRGSHRDLKTPIPAKRNMAEAKYPNVGKYRMNEPREDKYPLLVINPKIINIYSN